jgi:E3 ubiquitin-protein ligase MYCBP2
MKNLEMELAYLGGVCAASLMRRTLPLSMTTASGNDELIQDEDMTLVEESATAVFDTHSALLGKGLALVNPPSVQQALDGAIPFSCSSNERLFLRHFVQCAANTSGGRLARWLQPESYVDVERCRVLLGGIGGVSEDVRCGWPTTVTVVTHDQYDNAVQVPNMRVSQIEGDPLSFCAHVSSWLPPGRGSCGPER